MSYKVIPTDNFNKEVKQLAKKYHSLKDDLIKLRAELLENPTLGTALGRNVFKIRMAITSKGKGKSGGARVISYVYVLNEQIFLIDIYDKSERNTISDNDIKAYIKNLPI
ncbi:MAG: type II toxin-antitoxin system RelE/ParE family toxin [Bacteroidia bacterium]|nr:type II toxin-antitoxin system RelE/ParE family toxin [Bacteroidia bacterium]